MADKKEILDYLRNRQKAAEIEAKVNGINLWVLLGAIGVLGWTVLGFLHVDLWAHRELGVHVLLCAEALYLFSWLCAPTKGVREELRFEHWRAGDVDTPFLVLVEGLWLVMPPALHIALVGKSLSAAFVALVGTVVVLMSVVAIVMRIFGTKNEPERFPKPRFALSPESDVVGDVVMGAAYILIVWTQASVVIASSAPVDVVKVLALLTGLYLLILVAIRRRRGSHSIQWTYELETDVLVGAMSPDAALRRIENRALGSRLQDVMNSFFDELDRKLGAFEVALSQSIGSLSGIDEIPSEYQVERSARVNAATSEAKRLLDEMQSDVRELSGYLETLAEKKSDSRVAAAMESLASRKDQCRDKVESAKRSLAAVVQGAMGQK